MPMIICSNCGATNSGDDVRICRKCGALLPVSSRPPRIRPKSIDSNKQIDEKLSKKEKKSKKGKNKRRIPHLNAEAQFFASPVMMKEKKEVMDLQEIPVDQTPTRKSPNKPEIMNNELKKIDLSKIPNAKSTNGSKSSKRILQEITPKPFGGSIIAERGVYGHAKSSSSNKSQKSSSLKSSKIDDDALYRQKRLEEDMTNVLGFLSKKLHLPKTQKSRPKLIKEALTEKIPPTNMNEILKQLLRLDLNIEASAIIKDDGTILASAISNRISNSLFATIGMNLSMIGKDIIDGLSAGKLRSISVRGTNGVLDLAPVDTKNPNIKGMILIIFSSSRVKSGIIAFGVNIVKKQLIEFLQ